MLHLSLMQVTVSSLLTSWVKYSIVGLLFVLRSGIAPIGDPVLCLRLKRVERGILIDARGAA